MARAQVNQVASSLLGSIVPFAGAAAPTGYLLCDGSAISRTTYSELFAVVSTTWGIGDGSTTFNVPDLRGRHLKGTGAPGDGNGGDAVNLGAFQDHATAKNGLTNSTSSLSGTSGGQSVNHSHSIPAHGHDFWLNNSPGGGAARAQKAGAAGVEGTLLSQFVAQPSNGYGAGVQSGGAGDTGGYSVDHTHSTSGTAAAQVITGDSETRPKAYGVNYIIKT